MPGPILASAGSDWSYGGSLLTFLFPMIGFLAVAGVLWLLYTKPQQVPGSSYLGSGRSVSATPTVAPSAPGRAGPQAPAPGTAHGDSTQAGTAQAGTAQAGTAQAGTAQAGTAQAGTAQAGTAQAGTAQAGTAEAGE